MNCKGFFYLIFFWQPKIELILHGSTAAGCHIIFDGRPTDRLTDGPTDHTIIIIFIISFIIIFIIIIIIIIIFIITRQAQCLVRPWGGGPPTLKKMTKT